MWQKLTWMLFGQNSTWAVLRKAVRALIYQWKYAECFIWNFIKPPPLSLFPSLWPPPSLHLHFQNTYTKGDKSHCEPGRFPVLMTSCLQTHWNSVAGVMVAHTLTLALSEPYILSRYSNDLWSKWSVQFGWTLKMDVAALGNAALQRLEPGACKTQCREKHLHTHLN